MKSFRYIPDVATLKLNRDECVGCGMCHAVCPHRIFQLREKKAEIVDLNACIECGACAKNCPTAAISVNPGVGCASLIMSIWWHQLTGKSIKNTCC